MAHVHAEVLDLDDALVLWEVDVGLDVDVVADVVVQDLHLGEARGHLQDAS